MLGKKRTWILVALLVFFVLVVYSYLSFLPKVAVGEVGKLENSTIKYDSCILGKTLPLYNRGRDLVGDIRSDNIVIPILHKMLESGEIASTEGFKDVKIQVLQNDIPNHYGISKIRIVDEFYSRFFENKDWYVIRTCILPVK